MAHHPTALDPRRDLPNFQKVSDDLYRSAQPTVRGLRDLKALGLRTVISLRSFHPHIHEIKNIGLQYENIWIKSWSPKEAQITKFLQVATDDRRTPVLVHCQYGADRTGAMCAVYRIAVQGWTKERALQEMMEVGVHRLWGYLMRCWLHKLDIEKIMEKAGMKKPESRVCTDKADHAAVKDCFRRVGHGSLLLWNK
jgi:protein tyrosine phosphatase (PTP) superfamily phosphohydrolase (DUF442 family)